MSWFKVDDNLAFNAKVVTAGNEAMGLWVRAGSWCASQLQDGFVPTVMANAMANAMANGDDVASLVASGLWDEVDGGYRFHDWAEYQPSAELEKVKRKARSEAGKRGAASRWGEAKPMAKPMANAMANAMANECPVPSRPVPLLPTEVERVASATRARRLPADWQPKPETVAAITAEMPGADLRNEHAKFTDHFTANGKMMKDWNAAWRNWMRRSVEFSRGTTTNHRQQQTDDLFANAARRMGATYDPSNPFGGNSGTIIEGQIA